MVYNHCLRGLHKQFLTPIRISMVFLHQHGDWDCGVCRWIAFRLQLCSSS